MDSKAKAAVILSARFCEIARSVAGSALEEIQSGACPDQRVGKISCFDPQANVFPIRERVTQHDGVHPHVVLVMESPHIDEFCGDWGPAKGKTGTQIRKYLKSIVIRLGGDPSSELILVNAIQHQCSLGVTPKRYRDRVFGDVWKEGGEKDFKARLLQIYVPGDMLLNCCTGSHPHTGHRQLVTKAIYDSIEPVRLYAGPHPYSWFNKDRRQAVQLVAV